MPQPSILDARLAEIDRRLRAIQSGLVSEAGPESLASAQAGPEPESLAGAQAGPEPESPTRPQATSPALRLTALRPASSLPTSAPAADLDLSELVTQLRELAEAQERLLASTRQLLGAYADDLAKARAAADVVTPPPVAVSELSLSAGPFANTDALRGFERSLATLPEVRAAAVREYAGEDRAIVDVHLHDSRS